jgi:RHS repeat-associated protein
MLADDGPWQEPAWSLSAKFRVDVVPTGTNQLSDVYFWIFKDSPDPYADAAQLRLSVGDDGIAPGVAGLVLGGTIGDPGQATFVKTDWQANTDYCVRWIHAWGDLSRARVWKCTDPEPTSWQVDRDASGDTFTTGTNTVLQVVAFPEDPATTWFDEIALAQPALLELEPVPAGTESNPPYVNVGTAGDPVSTLTGAFSHTFVDTAIAGRGPSIAFARAYNSNDTRVGPLGPGWTHNYDSRLVDPGDGSGDVVLVGPQGRSDRYVRSGGAFAPPAGVHTTLVQASDGTFTATDKSRSSWRFDPRGRLIEIRDRYGNASVLGYDADGRLATISDPAGRGDLVLAYTGDRLTSITDWASPARTVGYEYDGAGRLWKVIDREAKVTTLTYDGTSARLASITDARGNVALTLTYDAQGRVATQKDARGLATGEATAFSYVVNGDGTRVTTTTAPATSFEPSFQPTIVDSYSAVGFLTSRVTRPSSTETLTVSFTYDGDGNRTSTTDARGATTAFCYDRDHAGSLISGSRGNLTRIITPPATTGAVRPVTLLAYDNADNLIQTVTPEGVASGTAPTCASDLSGFDPDYATDLDYDASNEKLLSITSRYTDPDLGPITAVTKYEYGDATNPGLVTRMIPPRGNTSGTPDLLYATSYAYFTSGSRAGLLERITNPLGEATSFDYDAVGRLVSSVDPIGNAVGGVPADHRTEYTYDREDRIRFVELPAPAVGGNQLVSETRYDEVGNPIVRVDPAGQVTRYAYDERDSLEQVQESPTTWSDPASTPSAVVTTEYDYDAGGNLIRVIRATGDASHERVTDYAFDGRGLVRRETQYPAWPTTSPSLIATTTYDPNGNVAVATDQLGRTTTMTYDALDRLTGIDYSVSGTPDVTYTYDRNDRRTAMVDGTGTSSYAYDELGRVISITSPGSTVVGYRYDRDGHRTKLIYPDATAVTYAFDKAGRLSGLSDWASRSVGYTYFPDGALKDVTNPDGSVATYTYDNARRLLDIAHTKGAATLASHSYTLDPLGNVTALTEYVAGITSATGWSAAATVNDVTTGIQLGPDVVVGPDGAAHAVWRDARPGSTGNDIYYARRDPATGVWSTNERVNNVTTGNQQEPRVGVDDAGNVYVLWTDLRNASDADIYFSKRTASTGTWSASVRVNDDGAGKRQDFPSLAVRPSGEAIAVWRDQRGGGQKYNVYSSRLAAGATSWATNRIVTSNASAHKERTGLAVGSTGIAYAVWHDERGGNADVWFASLPAGGTTWSTNTKISDDAGTAAQTNPDIGVDGTGNLIAVWEDSRTTPRQVRARHKPATGSWAPSVAISSADSREPSLALRTDGHAHLAWHNGPAVVGSTQSVWTADFDPGPATWSTPEQLSQLAAGTASGRASAAMDGSRTVVLFDGGPQTPSYNPEILVRVRTIASGTDAFSYGYDRLSRLTSVTNPGDDAGYSYDPVGNRLTKILGAATTTYSYDRADRISAAGATTFTVNAVGATTARGADTFAYDQINRLTSATVAGTTETYTYDGDGVRFSRQVGAGPVTRYVTDPAAGLPVSISDGTRKYVWGMGLAYAVSGADVEVYHADRLGSIRAITNGTGSLVASYRSDEFGSPVASSGSSTQPFRYTGEPLDGTGLTYLRARYYDPNLGRFASRDPWAGAVNRPQSLNRYVYVENAPIGKRDPSGQCLVDTAADAAFIVYDLVSLAFGPEKEREGNLIALGADVGAVFIPCATGAGMLVRVGRAATHVPEQIVLRVEDLIHIAERHLPGGVLTAGRSVFYDPNDVMRLIRQAETVVPSVQANGNLAFVVDAGREIGFDRVTGGATSIYTVITRPDRSVVTMFPGLP